jgi:hypothetical protein
MQVIFYPAGYRFLIKPILGPCWRDYVMSVAPAFVCSLLMLTVVTFVSSLLPVSIRSSAWALALLILLGGIVYTGSVFAWLKKDVRELLALATRRAASAEPQKSASMQSSPAPAPSR